MVVGLGSKLLGKGGGKWEADEGTGEFGRRYYTWVGVV